MQKRKSGQSNTFLRILALSIAIGLLVPSFATIDITVEDEDCITSDSRSYSGQEEVPRQLTTHSIVANDGMSWVNFGKKDNTGRSAEVYLTQSDLAGLTISSEFFGFWRNNRSETGESFDRIDVPGLTLFTDIGQPILPRLITYVEVPQHVDIAIQSVRGSSAIMEDYEYELAPAQPPTSPVWDANPADSVDIIFDESTYGASSFYPSFNANLVGESPDSAIILRGRRLLEVSFYPISYNPQSKNLKVYSDFVLRLNYSQPAQLTAPRAALRCQSFENVFERFLLNYKSWGETISEGTGSFPGTIQNQYYPASNGFGPTACENLIIVYDDFFQPAKDLAEWKNRTGLLTRVYTTTQVMNAVGATSLTSDVVKDFIQYAYDTWHPCPIYVLLFGDSDHIPTNYDLINRAPLEPRNPPEDSDFYYDQETGFIGSDLSYFTLDGNDYVPDVFYGRISVDSLANASVIVNKTLSYEQTPPDVTSFYHNILASGFFEDIQKPGVGENGKPTWVSDYNGDGIEDFDTQFIQESEAIRNYLEGLTDYDYIVHVNYTANTTDGHILPHSYSNGDSVGDISYWLSPEADDALYAISNITANFDEGRFLIYHVDHGGSKNMWYPNWGRYDYTEGWSLPQFNTSNVYGLANGALLPLVIDIDCNTGWFDGETDQTAMGEHYDSYARDCLAEILHRKKDGGAIAVIASSRIVFNYDSAALLNGTINAIWPGTEFSEYLFIHPIYEMGAALCYGKMNVLRVSGYEDSAINPEMEESLRYFKVTNTTFHEYHLFGDPSTPLWTEEPSKLIVKYPQKIGSQGTQKFIVEVASSSDGPIENAKVCIQKGDEAYQVGYTNILGYVEFQVTNPLAGEMNITVTKHNFVPHIGKTVIVESSAAVGVSPIQQKPGLSVDIHLTGFNEGQAISVYFGDQRILPDHMYSDPSTVFSVTAPEGNSGLLTVVANQTSEGPVATTTFYRLPEIETDLAIEYIRIYPYVVDSSGVTSIAATTTDTSHLVANAAYSVKIKAWNYGYAEATDARLELFYHQFGVGLARDQAFAGDIDVAPQGSPTGNWKVFDVDWTPIYTGHLCLIASVSDPNDVDTSNNERWLNTHVLGVGSPGSVEFIVSNNRSTAEYVSLSVVQQGNATDYWNASIRGFSGERMAPKQNVTVEFTIDLPDSVPIGACRLFTVSLSIKGEPIETLTINVTKTERPSTTGPLDIIVELLTNPVFIVGVFLIVVALVVVLYRKKAFR